MYTHIGKQAGGRFSNCRDGKLRRIPSQEEIRCFVRTIGLIDTGSLRGAVGWQPPPHHDDKRTSQLAGDVINTRGPPQDSFENTPEEIRLEGHHYPNLPSGTTAAHATKNTGISIDRTASPRRAQYGLFGTLQPSNTRPGDPGTVAGLLGSLTTHASSLVS